MFGNSFCFLFSKTCFQEYKEKKNSCIFEIKNMFGQLKLKRQLFEKKKNTKICCNQDLKFNVNSLNKKNLLN